MINKNPYNKYFFILPAFVFCCICLFIFYNQITSKTGFPSDLPAHISFIINPDGSGDAAAGYSFLHQFIKLATMLLAFTNLSKVVLIPNLMILTLVVSQFFSLMIVRSYFHKRYKDINPYFIDFMSLSLLIVSMIIINPLSPPFYLGTGTPNPWHSPTFIFCKPFSIVVFIFLLKSFDYFIDKKGYTKILLILSIFSVLSAWAKPVFIMSFLPSVAIIFIYKFLKNEITFKYLALVAISLLPAIVPLIFINNMVFHAANSNESIIVAIGQVWGTHSKNIPLSIVLASAFPLYVFILNLKQLSTSHLLAFTNYIIAMLIYFLLAEKGFRMYHGNFSWGYLFAMFLMFFVSIEEFFLKKKTAPIYNKIGWVLFILHLISGIYYLSVISTGHNYM